MLGMLWYSPILFGNKWMKMLNLKKDELEMKITDMVFTISSTIIGVFLVAFLLELIGNYSVLIGLATGALIAGLIFTTSISQVIYSKKPIKLFLIDSGYHAFSLLIVGILLGLWN